MGEYADELVERFSNPEPFRRRKDKPWAKPYLNCPKPQVRDEDRVWTMADGTTIRFGEMTPTHRGNCVRLLIRRNGEWVRNTPTVKALLALGIE
jgi:hypothetical protein